MVEIKLNKYDGGLAMKCNLSRILLLVVCTLFFTTLSFGAEDKIEQQPSVFFPEPKYDFGSVVEGTEVLHDFVIENKGDADLDVKHIKSG